MKTVILCGGIGYRLKEETEFRPKPMIEVGGKPILWHIMKIYEHFGFNEFIVALGYKGNLIKDYFASKKYYDGDFTIDTFRNKIKHYRPNSADHFKITFVDTGIESLTGERVRRVKKYIDSDNFMLTYGDGVADVNIKSLLKLHKSKKVLATLTGVHPHLKYGGIDFNKNKMVTKFEKKARLKQLINGGFMVLEKKVVDLIAPDSMIEDVFEKLALQNRLAVNVHEGFFHSMDTYQDVEELNTIWNEDPAWKIWT